MCYRPVQTKSKVTVDGSKVANAKGWEAPLFSQRFKQSLLFFHPGLHVGRRLHVFLHFLHGLDMGLIAFLEHVHGVLFALGSYFLEGFGFKDVVAGTAELVAGHFFHESNILVLGDGGKGRAVVV